MKITLNVVTRRSWDARSSPEPTIAAIAAK
jgi:hypothetical protein